MITAALIVAAAIVLGCYMVATTLGEHFRRMTASQEREAKETREALSDLRKASRYYVASMDDQRRERERPKHPGWITKEESDRQTAEILAKGGRVLDG